MVLGAFFNNNNHQKKKNSSSNDSKTKTVIQNHLSLCISCAIFHLIEFTIELMHKYVSDPFTVPAFLSHRRKQKDCLQYYDNRMECKRANGNRDKRATSSDLYAFTHFQKDWWWWCGHWCCRLCTLNMQMCWVNVDHVQMRCHLFFTGKQAYCKRLVLIVAK